MPNGSLGGVTDTALRLAGRIVARLGRDRAMESISWPVGWRPEARAALLQFVDSEDRVEIVVDDPLTAIHGTVIAGYVYREGANLMVVHDHSGRSGVHPWRLLTGPVLRVVGAGWSIDTRSGQDLNVLDHRKRVY